MALIPAACRSRDAMRHAAFPQRHFALPVICFLVYETPRCIWLFGLHSIIEQNPKRNKLSISPWKILVLPFSFFLFSSFSLRSPFALQPLLFLRCYSFGSGQVLKLSRDEMRAAQAVSKEVPTVASFLFGKATGFVSVSRNGR